MSAQGLHCSTAVASLLHSLNQLRQENQQLEESITAMVTQREQLIAVNTWLSLPLTQVNSQSVTEGPAARSSTTAMSDPAVVAKALAAAAPVSVNCAEITAEFLLTEATNF